MSTAQRPPAGSQPVVYVQAAEKNGLGISSFILGLAGSVVGLIPILAIPALAAGLVGFFLGLANIGRLRKGKASNKVMTGFGIGLSALAVVLAVIGMVIVQHTFDKLGT